MSPEPVAGVTFRQLWRAWMSHYYEQWLPPQKDQPTVIYDWKGCCKLCKRPKEEELRQGTAPKVHLL